MLNDEKTEFMDIGYYVSPIQTLDLGHDASTLSVSPVLAAKNLGFHFDHKIGNRLTYDLKVQLVHANNLGVRRLRGYPPDIRQHPEYRPVFPHHQQEWQDQESSEAHLV